MNWKTELRPAGIYDPRDGEMLYAETDIRPAWYWWIRRMVLFLQIVWRRYEDQRISIRTAWSVSEVAMGPTE